MAKIGQGSLQEKKGFWYFVVREADGKQRWSAMHTRDRQEAERRAAGAVGSAMMGGDRVAWLRDLVEKGEWAKRELEGLAQVKRAEAVAWDGLFEAWVREARRLTDHGPTLRQYEFQVEKLTRWARDAGIGSPAGVGAAEAQAWLDGRMTRGGVAKRDAALFSRMWRDLGLGDVWREVRPGGVGKRERYRRLSVEEVRRIVGALRAGMGKSGVKYGKGWAKPVPDVADLVALAYHTGLRRGDCVGLERGNVEGAFLRVIPAKTEERKGRALVIPLQDEARGIVERLEREAGEEGRLFPRLEGASLSKCLRLAWARAGVRSNGFGKASFHSLRATFISAMDEAGIPAHVTDAITGHAPAGMHGRYSQPGREALMEAVRRAIVPLRA